MLFRKSLRREDLDERQFSDEAQTYLAEIRGGCSEPEARARTKAEYPQLRDHHFVEWGQDEAFRGFMRDFQAIGAEARAWDAKQLEARRGYDPFSVIPARNDPDPSESGWMRRWAGREVVEGRRESQASNFTPLEDVTPAMQAELWAQHRATQPAPRASSPFRGGTLTKEQKERQLADGSYMPTDVERGFDGFPR